MNKRIIGFVTIITIMIPVLMFIQFKSVYAYVPSGTVSSTINAQYVPQQKSKWCWAASAENACLAENHHVYNQYYAVQTLKGTIDDQYPNVSGTIIDAANAVGVISSGYLTYTYSLDLAFNIIADKIYNSHPVIASLVPYYTWMGDGHAVLMMGWDTGSGSEIIKFYDPTPPGSIQTCDFFDFCTGNNTIHYNYRYVSSAYHN